MLVCLLGQVAHQAFGPAVLEPKIAAREAVKQAVDQVRQGKAPDVKKAGALCVPSLSLAYVT